MTLTSCPPRPCKSMRFVLFFCCCMLMTASYTNGQTLTDFIVVDQFGYRPDAEKIAVIRNPETGFDEDLSFTPGATYALVNSQTGELVFQGVPLQWNNGQTDASSGDQAWWFDFSEFKESGVYYVWDQEQDVRSFEFVIADEVYAEVLKQAVRTFYYQRAGYAKEAPYTDAAWSDGASHLGAMQDPESRKYDEALFSTGERDLRGGWYDAGDYNKYTPWTSSYVIEMLRSYGENPAVWGDNYCLPYSGNGLPDLMDEAKWGLDYLLRLQEPDGSMISIVSLDHGAPPSSAVGQSLYGGVNTISALAGAAAFAHGAKIFGDLNMADYSDQLLASAVKAWDWADQNPSVIWRNNDAAFNSVGIGAGQQETDDYGRFAYKMRAAIYLFEVTGESKYREFIDANYADIHLMLWNFAFPFEQENQEALLYYASLSQATPSVAQDIQSTYRAAMESENNFGALNDERDPYTSFLKDYVWGSNGTKSKKGLMFSDYVQHGVNVTRDEESMRAAERYIHYVHGLNPLNFCYLSNMFQHGADHGVTQFYHAWFDDGTDWDIAGVSKFGPAPGFLVGGANPTYDWDGCCPSGCSGNACDATLRDMIRAQPAQKAYHDFNTSWPMNSWSLSENSGGYQMAYIRLLSKFVTAEAVASTVCERVTNPLSVDGLEEVLLLFPNPSADYLQTNSEVPLEVTVYTVSGQQVMKASLSKEQPLDIGNVDPGVYVVRIFRLGKQSEMRVIIE